MKPYRSTRRTFLAAAASLPAWSAVAASNDIALYDSHIHFFTNDVDNYPIDPGSPIEPAETLRARIMRAPVTPVEIFPLWAANGVRSGAGVQFGSAYKTDNSYLLDLVDRHPAMINAEILVDAQNPKSLLEVERLSGTRRVSAVRLVGLIGGPDDMPWLNSAKALEVWAMAERLGIPICVTFLPPDGKSLAVPAPLVAIKSLAGRFPAATIVVEHFGWLTGSPAGPGMLPDHLGLRSHRNVRFKFTTCNIDELHAMGRSPATFVRRAVDLFGPDRLMWGSDYGHTQRAYESMVADAIAATAQLSVAERRRLLHDNGAKVFAWRGQA